ncbi:hypothetical protein [Telluribacter sp. SYSU D00476]|uniref:hypothetical protein n=1 Tax=Telluribacter sp. SYSU D00476 TaxID=2811430 RepID=UPI001FF3A1D1|nr:hypothetical protein [Telluribacter sp. SYSU D00476]
MKKHPVDDLFARKLDAWEPKPSAEVWQRIQAGQQKKQRRGAGWYWYAAASVAILLTAGYIVWDGPANNPTGLAEGSIAKVKKTTPETSTIPGTPAADSEAIAGSTSVPVEDKKPVLEYKSAEAIARGADTRKVVPIKPGQTTEAEPAERALDVEVAALAKEEVPASTPTISSPDLNLPATQPVGSVDKALRESTEKRVVIARVEVEDDLDEDHKSSRLIRILRQLKNAKEGEAVNWNEVGINPKKIMARADERIRNEEEKVSKQYNTLKEKLEL